MNREINWQEMYNASMDSVNLLNAGKPINQSDEEWADCVKRNVDHLKIILREEWPADFDLTPFKNATS